MKKSNIVALSVSASTLLFASQAVQAQSSEASESIQDIVVTAQRRESRLQETPISVTAISADTLAQRNVVALVDLPSLAPGVSVGLQSGFNRVYIRGIGMTSVAFGQDSSVAFHIDGTPIGRPSAQLSSFYDIERIEVLRGPQGTLYGRNATGGSINLITRKPSSKVEGYVEGVAGNYDLWQINAAVGGPVNASGSVRARIAGQFVDRDGYGRNVFLDQDIDDERRRSVRASMAVDLTPDVEILLTADYARENDHNYAAHGFGPYRSDVQLPGLLLGGSAIFNSYDIASDIPSTNRRENWGLSGVVTAHLSDALSLKTISSYRDFERFNLLDADTTTIDVATSPSMEHSKQLHNEVQLTLSSDKLTAIAGASYYHESLEAQRSAIFGAFARRFAFPDAVAREFGRGKIDALALYAEATYELLPAFKVTAGLRYSDEKRTSVGNYTVFNFRPAPNSANVVTPIFLEKSWNALTPKFGVDFKASKDIFLYATATRGFKSGVLNLGATNPAVNPEYIWAYEAGVKTTWFDRRLTANLSAFYYNYTDLQVSQILTINPITVNAAKARIQGIELSLQGQPTSDLRVYTDVALLDAKFTEFLNANPGQLEAGVQNLRGNYLPQAPRWTINSGAEYVFRIDHGGDISLRGDVNWRSRTYFSEFNDDRVSQKGYAELNASMDYRTADKAWKFGLYAKNLTNRKAAANFAVGGALFGYQMNGALKPPRTYGVRASYTF